MMDIVYKCTLLFVAAIVVSNSYAQNNLIRNNGFENGTGFPIDQLAQVNLLNNWEDRMECFNTDQVAGCDKFIHSPDWLPINGIAATDKFVGIANYELIQQKLYKKPKDGHLYYFQMDIETGGPSYLSWTNSDLKVSLSKDKIKYKSENNLNKLCTEDYVENENGGDQDIEEIFKKNISLSEFPLGGGWQTIATVFRSPIRNANIEDNFEWFSVDLVNTVYTDNGYGESCEDGYLFIDNLTLYDVCEHPCAPDLPAIKYYFINGTDTIFNSMPNALIPNAAPWPLFIQNAIAVEFSVFNSWGGEFFHHYAYDPNGLKNPGYIDYLLVWNGEDINGNSIMVGVYDYILKIWNCNEEVLKENSKITVSDPFSTPLTIFPNPGYVPQEFACPDDICCVDCITLSSENISGINTYEASNCLIADGSTIVSAGATINFNAGSEISLVDEFAVMDGAEWLAEITPCIAPICSSGKMKNEAVSRVLDTLTENRYGNIMKSMDNNKLHFVKNNDNSSIIRITPNPTTGRTVVNFSPEQISSATARLEIADIVGQKVFVKETFAQGVNNYIDLSHLQKGIYFLKISSNEEVRVEKVVIE